jgi:hypothetical protein
LKVLEDSSGVTFLFQHFGGEVDTLPPLILNSEATGASPLIFCVWLVHDLDVAIPKFLLQIHPSDGYAQFKRCTSFHHYVCLLSGSTVYLSEIRA